MLGALLGLLLSETAIGFWFASRAAVMLRIGTADTIWKGPVPMILGILGPFVYVLPLSILLILLIEPLSGTSAGKKLVGLKIIACDDAIVAGGILRKRLWYRTAIKTTFFWGLVVALLSGSWVLALGFSVVGFALLCNMVLSLFSSMRPAHDVLSQTCLAGTRT